LSAAFVLNFVATVGFLKEFDKVRDKGCRQRREIAGPGIRRVSCYATERCKCDLLFDFLRSKLDSPELEGDSGWLELAGRQVVKKVK